MTIDSNLTISEDILMEDIMIPQEILSVNYSKSNAYTIDVKVNEIGTNSEAKIWVEGKLSVENINSIHGELSPLFEQFQNIAIVLRKVKEIDLSCVQLLFYLKQKAQKKNKRIVISSDLKDDVVNVIRRNGFGLFLLNIK